MKRRGKRGGKERKGKKKREKKKEGEKKRRSKNKDAPPVPGIEPTTFHMVG